MVRGASPVRTCVGCRKRAQASELLRVVAVTRGVDLIVAEHGGEKIDIIPWNDDAGVFVANALSPAQVISVDIDEEKRIANVTVPERMLSLAIGREGQNARLAARLTGWRIDIRPDNADGESVAPADAGGHHGSAHAEATG